MSEKKYTTFSALNPRAFPAYSRKTSEAASVRMSEKNTSDSCEDDSMHFFLQKMTNGLSETHEARLSDQRADLQFPDIAGQTRRCGHAFSQACSLDDPTPKAGALSSVDADFTAAVRGVRPLKGKGRDIVPRPEPAHAVSSPEDSFQDLLEKSLEFSLFFSEAYIEGHVVGLDPLILQKLRAGRFKPEAHLDLHGFNARQAFGALFGFIRGNWYKGMRSVLVIPGKGRNSPDGVGVLRERVQSWLTQEPFKRVVLAFCTANSADGGAGSLYVLLRKYKKKGKVFWERAPIDLDM